MSISVEQLKQEVERLGTNGEVSCREISLRNVFRKNEVIYFSAYCYLKKQVKTFRADRVVLLEDLDNDMIFDKELDVFFAARLLSPSV